MLLIADEVICGFGRLGTPFGSHLYGMEPDLVTVAKGLTSAYFPLSGAIVGEKVYKVMEDAADRIGAFSHGYTYSGHPIGAAAANAVLDIVEKEDLAGKARDTGAYMQTRMKAAFAQMPIVGEVRGVGMLAAIEFVADRDKKTRFDAGAEGRRPRLRRRRATAASSPAPCRTATSWASRRRSSPRAPRWTRSSTSPSRPCGR